MNADLLGEALQRAGLRSYVVIDAVDPQSHLERLLASGVPVGIYQPDDGGGLRMLPPIALSNSDKTDYQPRTTGQYASTLQEALTLFRDMAISILTVGRFTIVKSVELMLSSLEITIPMERMRVHVKARGGPIEINTSTNPLPDIIARISDFTDSVVFVRTELPLYHQSLEFLKNGTKVTTIRFRDSGIEIPASNLLPLFSTSDYGWGDRTNPTAYVRISGIKYQQYGTLETEDAIRDGFASLAEMRRGLRAIYPRMNENSWITVYHLTLASAERT